jgi:hypothetical protein
MEFDQSVRQQWRAIRVWLSQWRTRAGVEAGRAADAGRGAFEHPRAGVLARLVLIVALVFLVLYPALAWWHSTIDDDPAFSAKTPRAGMSHVAANAAALINREVKKHGWTPNSPWFSPYALLDDMPNYQSGMIEALANVVHALNDRRPDQNLQSATDLLHYRPDAWLWNSSTSQYRLAAHNLRDYNAELAGGQATFDHSAAALAALLDRLTGDLDGVAARIDTQVAASGWPFDTVSDDVFYNAKGHLYADLIMLDGAAADYAPVLASRGLTRPWDTMIRSLRAGASLRPWMVLNGSPGASVFGCTLCGEGFYLVEARDQMRAIRDSLGP